MAVMLTVPVAVADGPSAATRAKAAVKREVRATFSGARGIVVSCRRVDRNDWKCGWRTAVTSGPYAGDSAYHDYHGRASAEVNRFGSDAKLLRGVHCHFCESGPVPRRLR